MPSLTEGHGCDITIIDHPVPEDGFEVWRTGPIKRPYRSLVPPISHKSSLGANLVKNAAPLSTAACSVTRAGWLVGEVIPPSPFLPDIFLQCAPFAVFI